MDKNTPCRECGHIFDSHDHNHFHTYCSVRVPTNPNGYCACEVYRKPRKRFLFW